VCDDGLEAVPVEKGDCPAEKEASLLQACNTAPVASLCQGDGLCGDTDLDNCGEADIYLKKVRRCPNDEGIKGFRYSHPGYWATGAVFAGTADSVEDCAKFCDDDDLCVAFSRHQFQRSCYTYTELGQRVLGSPSDAYMKCDDSASDLTIEDELVASESEDDTVDMQMKYGHRNLDPRAVFLNLQSRQSLGPGAWMTMLLASSAGATFSALLCWAWRVRHSADLRISQRAMLIPSFMGDAQGGSNSVTSGFVAAFCADEDSRMWREGRPDEFSHTVRLQASQQDDL